MRTEIDQKKKPAKQGAVSGENNGLTNGVAPKPSHSNGSQSLGTSPVRELVRAHLGVADEILDDVPTITTKFDRWRHISVHAALDSFIKEQGNDASLRGVPMQNLVVPSLAELLITPDLDLGPIDYVNLPAGPDISMACVRSGLLLAKWGEDRIVAWVRLVSEDKLSNPRHLAIEVKTTSVEAAQAFLAAIRERMPAHDPYRGKSLKLNLDRAGNITSIDFQPRPHVSREQLILRPGVLEAVESHAIGIGEHADRLRAAGRHLKRGLLLYGPPGTGKTHTIRYLSSRLKDATLFVLTGGSMHQMKVISGLLSELAPAIVVLDDVDLIAEDRSNAGNAGSALFNLLDAMDGMKEDVDVLFVCTSNRAESLEKALAARPGRIDQAIELDVPDAESRRRLIDVYAKGLDLQLKDTESVIDRTEGVTASFIKELLRRASLVALVDESPNGNVGDRTPIKVTDRHVHAALDILLDPAKPLTSALLGIHKPPNPDNLERTKQRGVGTAWCGI